MLPIPEYWGFFLARKFEVQAGEWVDNPPALRTLDAPQDLGMLITGDGVGGRGVSGSLGVLAESGYLRVEGGGCGV